MKPEILFKNKTKQKLYEKIFNQKMDEILSILKKKIIQELSK